MPNNVLDNAPKDQHILVKNQVWAWTESVGYSTPQQGQSELVEAWFNGEKWVIWVGNERTSTTHYLDPIAWTLIPEELRHAE
jgi:hypothetical protein